MEKSQRRFFLSTLIVLLLFSSSLPPINSQLSPHCTSNLTKCRQNLMLYVFGEPSLPIPRPPGVIENIDIFSSPSYNRTHYQWEIFDPFMPETSPKMKASVYLTLNASGHVKEFAPSTGTEEQKYSTTTRNEGEYAYPHWPTRRGGTLILYIHGHEKYWAYNYENTAQFVNELGYDVAEFSLPLYGFNQGFPEGVTANHGWFEQWEKKGVHCFRYWAEPVVQMVSYAKTHLGYEHIHLMGKSGGGWATTLLAALDERIELSFPIAGGVPFFMRSEFHESWDWEQSDERGVYSEVASFEDWMLLGSVGKGRGQIQILHQSDPCCFCVCGREDNITLYNKEIRGSLPPYGSVRFRTVGTVGNLHVVNGNDLNVVGMMLSMYRSASVSSSSSSFSFSSSSSFVFQSVWEQWFFPEVTPLFPMDTIYFNA